MADKPTLPVVQNPNLVKLQEALLRRGANTISRLGKQFRIMDDDRSYTINFEEFMKGLNGIGVALTEEEARDIFSAFDKDGGGSLNFDEFLCGLRRGSMNDSRTNVVMQAFGKMDKSGDGFITVNDLKGVYNVRQHKKFQSGEWDEKRCLEEFLKNFDSPDDPDAKVTLEEFLNYYTGLSASIDEDAVFDLMVRNAWKM